MNVEKKYEKIHTHLSNKPITIFTITIWCEIDDKLPSEISWPTFSNSNDDYGVLEDKISKENIRGCTV